MGPCFRIVAALLVSWSAALAAHPLSVSYSRFTVGENDIASIVRLPLDDVDLLLRLDRDLDGTVADVEIERANAALQRYLSERIQINAAGVALASSLQGTSRWKDQNGFPYLEARLSYSAPQRIDDLAVTVSVLTDLYTDHRNLSEIEFGGRREQFVFQHRNTYSERRDGAGSWQTARSFVRLGIEHIFTGYDHILFLFGLLLVGKGLKNLVAIVTSFTIAHSLTLSLATLGVVEPAAWTVEAAIALSIAYIGLENLFVKDVRHRWRITFAFGLIHGLGFANVLREMELARSALAVSLFAFNLGVEIGQVAILALMWPLLRYLERTPYRLPVVRVASAVIVAFGLFWFWQRIV
jgi:hydrogenase/urease accessory protein HupE